MYNNIVNCSHQTRPQMSDSKHVQEGNDQEKAQSE